MASRLDDGMSGALTIAYAVVAACNAEIVEQADLVAQGEYMRSYSRQRFKETSLQLATQIVLLNRSKGR
jgi:hypothetical protein